MGKHVLTIDDSPSVRKLVEFALKLKGFEVDSAEDGQEGLERMREERFDAIVLDVNMPRMDGLEFLRRIRADQLYASIPVIMLTTEGQERDKDKAIELGATAYIVKPFKPTQLLELVDEVLASS
jgi:two-component system chemotaxis response regulator CheY